MADHSSMKLGRLPTRLDHRRLQLARFLPAQLPAFPDSIDQSISATRGKFTNWGMLANDSLGDCTIAGVGHAVQLYCHRGWGEVEVTDPEVISYYSKWCGYNSGDPNTDQGGVEPDVLDSWRQQGFNGHFLKAYADPVARNMDHVKLSISLFGCVYLGVDLPVSCQTQDIWDAVSGPDGEPGSWGGHCVIDCKYAKSSSKGNPETRYFFITWGEEKEVTDAFWQKYVSETHTLFHKGWYPQGFSAAQLDAALGALGSPHA